MRMMRVEASCLCNLLFLALSHRCQRALAGPAAGSGSGRLERRSAATTAIRGGPSQLSGVEGGDEAWHEDAAAILEPPAPLSGGAQVPCLVVVLVHLLYRAGSSPEGARGGSQPRHALRLRFPTPYKKLLCLLRLSVSLVLSPRTVDEGVPAAASDADNAASPSRAASSSGGEEHETSWVAADEGGQCKVQHLRRWTKVMATKYPCRAPRAVVDASQLLVRSLQPWPGLPSFDMGPSGGCGAPGRVTAGGRPGWAPDLDLEIDLDACTGWQGGTHAGARGAAARAADGGSAEAETRVWRPPAPGGAERLYAALLQHLPSLVVALLKILLAAGVNASPPLGGAHGNPAGAEQRAQAELLACPPVDDMKFDLAYDAAPAGLLTAFARRRERDSHAHAAPTPERGRTRRREPAPRGGREPERGGVAEDGLLWEEQVDQSGRLGGGRARDVMDGALVEWARYRRVMCQQAPAVLQLLLQGFRSCHYLQVGGVVIEAWGGVPVWV